MSNVKAFTGRTVVDEAVERIAALYRQGDRVVVTISGGKDSTILMETTILAARQTGNLPVDVALRDDEIMLPPTWDYLERVAERPEVRLHWMVARQPVLNVFNRANPYWWAFDPALSPEQWVRKPPPCAIEIPEKTIMQLVIPSRFPAEPGKRLMCLVGVRAQESSQRLLSVHKSKGFITKVNAHGAHKAYPLYDWMDGDVWKAIHEFGWDYNRAYDAMLRHGVPRKLMRIAPPTQHVLSIPNQLRVGLLSWPKWFDRVEVRCPGVRTAVQYGERAVWPQRRLQETWEDCFRRTCIEEAPAWIADRAREAERRQLNIHRHHATTPFPDVRACLGCSASAASWKQLARMAYCGDPFSQRLTFLPYVEPEFFRPGMGKWGGSPSA